MKLYRRIQLLPTYFSSTFRKKSCLVFTYSRCSKSETRSFTACWSKEVHGSSWAGGVLSTLGKGGAGERSTLYTCSQIVTTGTWMLLCSSIFLSFPSSIPPFSAQNESSLRSCLLPSAALFPDSSQTEVSLLSPLSSSAGGLHDNALSPE